MQINSNFEETICLQSGIALRQWPGFLFLPRSVDILGSLDRYVDESLIENIDLPKPHQYSTRCTYLHPNFFDTVRKAHNEACALQLSNIT